MTWRSLPLIFLVAALPAIVWSCSKESTPTPVPAAKSSPELRKILAGDPSKDQQSAFEKRDFRFIDVMGVGRFTPGIERADEAYPKKYGTWVMPDVTDSNWIPQAAEYAATYNQALLKKLKQMEQATSQPR